MPQYSLCNDKFQLDDPHVVDPRADSRWECIEPGQLARVIKERFAEPVDFPPIPQAVLSEDRIAIAVEPDTPCGLEIARLVASRFVEQGNDPGQISILGLEKESPEMPEYVQHDPLDPEQMAYLCVDKEGVPIYVNRILFDADIVVPIGTGDGGRRDNLICPSFCDQDTKTHVGRMTPDDARALSHMVESNLGVFWQIRLVTVPGEQVVQVLVGSSEKVLQQSGELGRQVWNLQIEQPADMVLATIESSSSQNWRNLRRAILTADRVATDDAVIVLCTELQGKPPSTWPTPNNQTKKKDNDLNDVFQRRHVYLASRLNQDSTEQFGFGHLENSTQIQKLIDQHETCLLLRDAHRVGLQVKETV